MHHLLKKNVRNSYKKQKINLIILSCPQLFVLSLVIVKEKRDFLLHFARLFVSLHLIRC